MDWWDQIYRYCERGQSAAFWAEPFNAVTNLAFILAALAAALELARRRDGPHPAAWALTGLVFVIGVGSFLFHTYATRWAAVADVAPIGLFMIAYLVYALRAYLRLGWIVTAVGLAVFVGALQYAGDIQCRNPGLLSVTAAARGPCLNGTLGYAPAFLAMLGIGVVLAGQRHPAGRYVLAASIVFLVSMLFRTIDWEVCALTRIAGRARGTHFLWHVLNATTLYLLLRAAIRNGRTTPRRAAGST